jgi:hypothetical protein
MAVIRVPKTPSTAYDPERPAGTLLTNQLRHLEWAIRPAAARTEKAFRVKSPTTEGEAAERIAKLTAQLYSQATAPRDVLPPNPEAVMPAPVAEQPKSRSKPKPAAKAVAKSKAAAHAASKRPAKSRSKTARKQTAKRKPTSRSSRRTRRRTSR